ncbi:MAG: alpha-N-arabinofuranosidase [Crenarchaeota archaeon]|nr:alpha-N-arabinofuranosidase [Thermoproteota archaeon]MDW8033958.1 alpha-L-arabinofuranosidase C-terminal domain-containing protein [Nitrososphaerota archaeon]
MTTKNQIVVYTRIRLGNVSPNIYGFNIEHIPGLIYGAIFDEDNPLSDSKGFRRDVVEACKRIRVPILRWPGGNFVSGYNWLDGIGPKDERPTLYDLAWGTEETNRFGTDEFIEFCRLIGAEPFITVNAGSGTAIEAARWVEYCNRKGKTYYTTLREKYGHPEPYNVKYWSLGNEMWGDFQIGNLPAKEYARKARDFAKLMRRVDPSLNLTAVGHTLRASPEWNLTVLTNLIDLVDNISVHEYFFGMLTQSEEENYYRILSCPVFAEEGLRIVEETINVARAVYRARGLGEEFFTIPRRPPEREIGIAFDEWNISGCHTLRDALGICRILNVFQRHVKNLKIACMFPLIHYHERIRMRGGHEMFYSPLTAYKDTLVLEAGYHAFDLYVNHTGEIAVFTHVDSETYSMNGKVDDGGWEPEVSFKDIPYLDASSTLSEDGKILSIAVVNAHRDLDIECLISLKDFIPGGKGEVFELNAKDVNAYNDREDRNNVVIMEKPSIETSENFTYTFPAHSATIIKIPLSE